jgi:hypothetical protein
MFMFCRISLILLALLIVTSLFHCSSESPTQNSANAQGWFYIAPDLQTTKLKGRVRYTCDSVDIYDVYSDTTDTIPNYRNVYHTWYNEVGNVSQKNTYATSWNFTPPKMTITETKTDYRSDGLKKSDYTLQFNQEGGDTLSGYNVYEYYPQDLLALILSYTPDSVLRQKTYRHYNLAGYCTIYNAKEADETPISGQNYVYNENGVMLSYNYYLGLDKVEMIYKYNSQGHDSVEELSYGNFLVGEYRYPSQKYDSIGSLIEYSKTYKIIVFSRFRGRDLTRCRTTVEYY